MANSMERFVKSVAELSRRLENVERNNQSQAFTSIENTRLEFRDEDGNVTGTLGIQDDGSTGFVPVLPPKEVKEPRVLAVPTAPFLDQGVGTITVTWDGLTVDHEEFPKDFYSIEVHASEVADFNADELTLVSAMYETDPSSVVVGPIISGTWYFRLVLRARNGERSAQSDATVLEQEYDINVLTDSIENSAGGGTNYYTETKPEGGTYTPDDLWFDASKNEEGIASWMPHRWDETEGDWVSIADERVQVIADAQKELESQFEQVESSVNSKAGLTYSESAPDSSTPGVEGDSWFHIKKARTQETVQRTNLALTPSMGELVEQTSRTTLQNVSSAKLSISPTWATSGTTSLRIAEGGSYRTGARVVAPTGEFLQNSLGKTYTVSVDFHLEKPQVQGTYSQSRRLTFNYVNAAGSTVNESVMSEQAPNVKGTVRLSVSFTVPTDAQSWNVVAFNGSVSDESFWDSLVLEEGNVSNPTYFDGDSASPESEDEPHFRWTGEAGKSTSQMFLPANTHGDQILGQYRYENGSWRKIEGADTSLIETVRDSAVLAQQRADEALSSAEQAKADAVSKAAEAEQAAITAAEADAKAKADAAQAAAATDATTKADAAEARAKAEAALDAKNKADAAQAAAEAKAKEAKDQADAALQRADQAHSAAGDASVLAQSALDAATHVGKNLYSTANPSGTAPQGTMWFKVDTTGKVVGQWQQTGGSPTAVGSTWTKRDLTNTVISNLDAGKITSGYLAAARIKAGSLEADTVLVPGSAGSTVIKNGAITTEKIATGAITAESGVIGSLDLGKATVGELDGLRIKAGTITSQQLKSTAIDAMTITGATFQTGTTGARVLIDQSGFKAYNGSGVSQFDFSTVTGKATFAGAIESTDSNGYAAIIDSQRWNNDVANGMLFSSQASANVADGYKPSVGLYSRQFTDPLGNLQSAEHVGIQGIQKDSTSPWGFMGVNYWSLNIGFSKPSATAPRTKMDFLTNIHMNRDDFHVTSVSTDQFPVRALSFQSHRTLGDPQGSTYTGNHHMKVETRGSNGWLTNSKLNMDKSGILEFEGYSYSSGDTVNGSASLKLDPYQGGNIVTTGPMHISGASARMSAESAYVEINSTGAISLSSKSGRPITANGVELGDSGSVAVAVRSPFKYYSTSADDKFSVRKVNGVVTFSGTASGNAPDPGIFAVLPVGYRPAPGQRFSAMMQGSGQNTWQLTVYSNGECKMDRYGPGTPSSNVWLPFSATFMAAQ